MKHMCIKIGIDKYWGVFLLECGHRDRQTKSQIPLVIRKLFHTQHLTEQLATICNDAAIDQLMMIAGAVFSDTRLRRSAVSVGKLVLVFGLPEN